MESTQSNSVQNFDDLKTDILKKRLLKSSSSSVIGNITHNNTQQNVLINSLSTPISSSMLVSSVQGQQNSMALTHNIVTHSIAPMKIHTNSGPYPLQLSTVHVPLQIPGSTSNINVPVQLAGPTSTVPLQLTAPTVSLPLQVSGTTTNVPVQLPAGETINVPLQLPAHSQSIQLTTPTLPSMPLLQNPTQPLHSSIIHVHVGNNSRGNVNVNMDPNTDISLSNSQLQLANTSGGLPMKIGSNIPNSSQVQITPNNSIIQIPSSTNNTSIQLQLPNSSAPNSVQIRGASRTMPHLVYIQTPSGLKPVSSTDVMSQASSSGNPPQIIVRKPVVTSTAGIQLKPSLNSKTNLASKASVQNKPSILATNSSQPIVIPKPKLNEKIVVPVSIASGTSGKPTIAYLGSVKKSNTAKIADQSILIPNNQLNSGSNQKLYVTPMGMPKIHNKFIMPVTLPTSMSSKGPIINLQIANGQLQNDPQGNITVLRDTSNSEINDVPPLKPLAKVTPVNNKEGSTVVTAIPQNPKSEKSFALSIPGSRAEPIGEQEYALSIPETNASMNDDLYTLSIADDEGGQTREKSFTLTIPDKGKSLLNKIITDRNDNTTGAAPAPAILRRSNSDNAEKKVLNAHLKRRISLCNENFSNKTVQISVQPRLPDKTKLQSETDDHRVPSLFCDEKLDKELESKVHPAESDPEDYNNDSVNFCKNKDNHYQSNHYSNTESDLKKEHLKIKREISLELTEEDPPGLVWSKGVAHLQGSRLLFRTNEFGMIDLMDSSHNLEVFSLNPGYKYNTPLKQRIDVSGKEKKPTSPEDLYSCDGCGCHGMAADFITPNFCSLACRNQVQKANQLKKDRERVESNKRRKKMKRLLMRMEKSNSEVISDGKDEKSPSKQCDSVSNEMRVTEAAMMKMNEDISENEKYPWMSGKNGFSWIKYLEYCKAKPAPTKLFKDPFPYNRNGFKIGMRMEAIDPSHPSMFCVVSVAETQGYRLRLHFDGYPDVYDYWINADSVDVFPPGWCEKNGRTLKPPAEQSAASFSWPLYLKQMRAVAAPKHLFPHLCGSMVRPNGFRIGMKLEAEDRKNKLVCVATVADMLDNRILINFDSWDEIYDYWVDPTSPYIHPVGWAEENDIPLTPPNFYKDPDTFAWEKYLSETGSAPAPARAFKTRAPHDFRVGMKLEVVDPRVPFLIRVASVSEVKGHQIRISFDGWPDEFTFWFDDDSPEIHPVGWCLKTYHPLEPPLMAEEASTVGPCGVGGCRGLGSALGGAHKAHSSAATCPYRAPPPSPRDRLQPQPDPGAHALPRTKRVAGRSSKPETSTPTSDTMREKPTRGRPPKHKQVEEAPRTEPGSDEESLASSTSKRCRSERGDRSDRTTEVQLYARSKSTSWGQKVDLARVEAGVLKQYSPRAADRALGPTLRIQQHLDALKLPPQPETWAQNEVCLLVTAIAGAAAGRAAAAAQLSGADLLTVSCDELLDCLKLRLGPAIKVYAAIRQLRQKYM